MFILDKGLQWIAKGKLSVFLFHKVPAAPDPLQPGDIDQIRFQHIVDFITEHFQVCSLGDAARLLAQGRLPDRCAAITFDDGYADWLNGPATILAKRAVPATFFITTGQFAGRPMWHERLAHVVRAYKGEVLDTRSVRLPPLSVQSVVDKVAAIQALEYHFKYLPPVIREAYLLRLEEMAGTTMTGVAAMSAADLVQISNMGFDIGAHTVDHPIIGLCDADQAKREIGEAKEVLQGLIKRPVDGFAYPNGRPGVDFSHRHIEMVKACGYQYAVTTQWGAVRRDTSPYQMPRFTPWGPSTQQMAFQVLRNIFTKPDSLAEQKI